MVMAKGLVKAEMKIPVPTRLFKVKLEAGLLRYNLPEFEIYLYILDFHFHFYHLPHVMYPNI